MNSTDYEQLISTVVRRMSYSTKLIERGLVAHGRPNKWKGISGYSHQIDVSLDNEQQVLLVECKYWKEKNVPVEALLTMLGRVIDISRGPRANGRMVRGALVTSRDFQAGVYTLAGYYSKEISLFHVLSIDDFVEKLHIHFIENAGGIPSGEAFGIPTVISNKRSS